MFDDIWQVMSENQRPLVIWFTGLSGSGKTTLASHLQASLLKKGFKTYLLDGDVLRTGLNVDLGFSAPDRTENIRRAAEVARLFSQAGFIVLATFISPFEKDRIKAKEIIGSDFLEVFVECPIEICEKRDPKGLYKKARAGMIKDFTGISSPYEHPTKPAIVISTGSLSLHMALSHLESEVYKLIM